MNISLHKFNYTMPTSVVQSFYAWNERIDCGIKPKMDSG